MIRLSAACLAAALVSAASRPAACTSPEFRQFDFWVGEWEVTKRDGQIAGVNRIAPILRGCVLHEDWHGAQGGAGQSFNIYDAASGKWRQTWVSDDGVVLLLEGGLVAGKMVLAGRRPSGQHPGAIILDRVTWTPLAGGDVRQLWEASEDDGATWRTVFDGRYVKRRAVSSPGG
jgi:hypothetical protein